MKRKKSLTITVEHQNQFKEIQKIIIIIILVIIDPSFIVLTQNLLEIPSWLTFDELPKLLLQLLMLEYYQNG